jgi:hypothetical protein
MYVVLSGSFEVKTHWKLKEGHDDFQKFYQDYLMKQQGHLTGDLLRQN